VAQVKEWGGAWSEAKLECVEEYAARYLQVFQNQHWAKLEYVDAFAGSGLQKLKKTRGGEETVASLFGDKTDQTDAAEFIEGSPIRAIRASTLAVRGFDGCVLVESNRRSCDELEARVRAEFGPSLPPTRFECGDANDFLKGYAAEYDRARTRSLVFLDPFGCEVEWETVAALGATQACDVWYLFPLGGAMRMMTTSGDIDPAWETILDRVFGGHDWRDHFYSQTTQETLFGNDATLTTRDATTDRVVGFIRERLASAFAGVAEPAVLRNGKGSPMFALVLAVANPSKKAKRAALGIANYLTRRLNSSP
jgi:three-Cys-motif partner protein